MRSQVQCGVVTPGGVVTYPLDQLYQEVAYIAYHFHWRLDEILELEHPARHQWVEEIARINRAINEGKEE